MEFDCPYLSLARAWAGEDDDRRIALVDSLDALRLCGDGGYEAVSASTALWDFENECRRLSWEIQDFVYRLDLASPFSIGSGDDDLAEFVGEAIKRGNLVGLRKSNAVAVTKPTVEQRRLVAEIESKTRGRLSQGGRQYKLVAGNDLAGVADRNSYEVVGRDEAKRVLDQLSRDPGIEGELAALLGKARDKLTPDWRPPLAPNGLVLLRRTHEKRAVVASQEPALTPSQLWGKAGKDDDDIIDWIIWIELDPADPKASDDVVILLDEFYQEVMRKPLVSCPREGTGVLVKFEKIGKHDRFTLIRDYGPNEGGGEDTLFMDSTPAEMDERGRQVS